MSDTPDEPIQFMRLREVKEMVGLSTMTIYRLVAAGQFPSQVKLGPNSVAWVKSEVQEWCRRKVEDSRTPSGKAPE